jgi:hypothetical protein
LRELRRVTRAEGKLFFSTHNLAAIERAFSLGRLARDLRAGRSPARYVAALAKRLPAQALQRIGNPPPRRLRDRDRYVVSKRWPPLAPVTSYHSSARETIRQCADAGWELERMLLPSGEPVPPGDGDLREPLWLNFLCRAVGR